MPKSMKIAVAVLMPLVVIVGAMYGLAKIGVLPVGRFAEKNKALGTVLKMAGLYRPRPRAVQSAAPAPDPLAGEKKELAAQRAALEQERAALQAQREAQQRPQPVAQTAERPAPPDPKNIARLASVYEQMPPETVTRIFAKLPNDQVIALLHRMDEKQVGQILALLAPDRAARLTVELAQPAPDSTPRTA